jgi:hypothetical protein
MRHQQCVAAGVKPCMPSFVESQQLHVQRSSGRSMGRAVVTRVKLYSKYIAVPWAHICILARRHVRVRQ